MGRPKLCNPCCDGGAGGSSSSSRRFPSSVSKSGCVHCAGNAVAAALVVTVGPNTFNNIQCTDCETELNGNSFVVLFRPSDCDWFANYTMCGTSTCAIRVSPEGTGRWAVTFGFGTGYHSYIYRSAVGAYPHDCVNVDASCTISTFSHGVNGIRCQGTADDSVLVQAL